MISASDANTIFEGGNVPRQWLLTALSDPGISHGTGLFLANIGWKYQGKDITLSLIGLDVDRLGVLADRLERKTGQLVLPDVAILDTHTRGVPSDVAAGIRPHSPLTTELAGQTMRFSDTFVGGLGFTSDGYAITSDQTFLRLFPKRRSGTPDHILLSVAAGHSVETVVTRLQAALPDDLRVRSLSDASAQDVSYQTTERPTGLIFGFGVLMGVLVGVVIVYQVLSTDVADHLSEYATFKAMGYGPRFFLGIVFEEAAILAVLGFIPGFAISALAYAGLNAATGLPMSLDWPLAVVVLLGTLAACAVSGAIATRRLNAADPADLF